MWTPRWTWKPTSRRISPAKIPCCFRRGVVPRNSVVKIAQTFRTGTNDIDALDFVEMYLNDESQHQQNLHDFNDLYVLVNFRPVRNEEKLANRLGVAGYDNRLGLPPFPDAATL